MTDPLEKVLADWAKLGVLYGVSPARRTPDVEDLLLRTSQVLPSFARLLPTTVTWLVQFERLVCRHRLARMAGQTAAGETSAALGLVLDLARQHSRSEHLAIALQACRVAEPAKPLFAVDRNGALAELAQSGACPTARRWGLWTPDPELKPQAVRPARWLIKQNPDLRYRALFGGNLRASILATLQADPDSGRSESALARSCAVTRKALREALEHLEFCGLVHRQAPGAGPRVALAPEGMAA